jgi:hypothetical protein
MDTDKIIAEGSHRIAESCRAARDDLIDGGITWYPDPRFKVHTVAGREVFDRSRKYGLPYKRTAAVVAICNLNNTWSGSLTQTDRLLAAWAAGRKTAPRAGLPLSCSRAWAILQGAALTRENIGGRTGNKTWSFFLNLCGDHDAVTIDRWACRAAGLPDATHATDRGYALVAECYRVAADELGWTPAQTQAVAWTAIRGRIN